MNAFRLPVLVLPFAPVVLLSLIWWVNTGGNYSVFFYFASATFVLTAIVMVAAAVWKRRPAWAFSGSLLVGTALACLFVGGSGTCWVGQKTMPLLIVVQDGDNGGPIPNASVKLYHRQGLYWYAHDSYWIASGLTDAAGKLQLNHAFTAAGTESPIKRTGTLYSHPLTITLNAKGYTDIEEPLETFTGAGWDLYSLPLPDVEVKLKKK